MSATVSSVQLDRIMYKIQPLFRSAVIHTFDIRCEESEIVRGCIELLRGIHIAEVFVRLHRPTQTIL